MWQAIRYLGFVLGLLTLLLVAPTGRAGNQEVSNGYVRLPDGSPVADATVYLLRTRDREETEVARVQTGKGGDFRLPNTAQARAQVLIHKSGYAFATAIVEPGQPLEIVLEPGRQVRGIATDSVGKPLAGVALGITRYYPPVMLGRDSTVYLPGELGKVSLPGATTKADGTFLLKDLPSDGEIFIEGNAAGFRRTGARIFLRPTETTVNLKMWPAGVLTGKVLKPDGAPMVGARVMVYTPGISPVEAVTDATGTYRFTALMGMSYTLFLNKLPEGAGDFAANPLADIKVEEGKTVTAPDLRLVPGAVIEGIVQDSSSGSFLPGAELILDSKQYPNTVPSPQARSDNNGRFRFVTVPGPAAIHVVRPAPDYYVSERGNVEVDATASRATTAILKLEKGASLNGVAQTDTGAPVPWVTVVAFDETGMARYKAEADALGNWTLRGLQPQEAVFLQVESTRWSLKNFVTARLPMPEKVSLTLTPLSLLPLEGRVVNTTGKPVADLRILVVMSVRKSAGMTSSSYLNTITDSEGCYRLKQVRADAEYSVGTSAQGYQKKAGGVGAVQGNVVAVNDLVLVGLHGTLKGVVRNGQGKPVSNVLVLAAEGSSVKTQARTDAKGAFQLTELPDEGEVTVLAAGAGGFTKSRHPITKEPIFLTLEPVAAPPGPDAARALRLIESAAEEAKGKTYRPELLYIEAAPYDPDWAVQRITRAGRSVDEAVENVFFRIAGRDPSLASRWIGTRLATINDENSRRRIRLQLGILSALQARPDLAGYRTLKAEFQAATNGGWKDELTLYLLMRLGLILRDPDAETLARKQFADELKRVGEANLKNDAGLLPFYLKGIASANLTLALSLVSQLPENVQTSLLSEVIRAGADRFPQAAREALAQVRARDGDAGYNYGKAALAVVRAQASRNPADAWTLATTIYHDEARPFALAEVAAVEKDSVKRGVLFATAMTAARQSTDDHRILKRMTEVAIRAWRTDPEIGRVLFKATLDYLLGVGAPALSAPFRDEEDVTTFGFYYARINPALARLFLEAAWERQRSSGDTFAVRSLALAMAAVNTDRALEMADALPGSDVQQVILDTRRKITQYIAAPEEIRRSLPFDRWAASDNWLPGTPSGW